MKTNCLTLILAGLLPFFSNAQEPCESTLYGQRLNVNNVNTVVFNNPYQWGCTSAQYEIPKGSGKHSLFAGGIWLSGIDDQGQLHVAAQTYRQTRENDFWPGPLNNNATTNKDECLKFGTPFVINKFEVMEFVDRFGQSNYTIPSHFYTYPAEGNTAGGYLQYLAPFVDVNNDGNYNPDDGDYPDMGLNASDCQGYLKGHQNVFTIFNDAGSASSLGVEIHKQSYAYSTTDILNICTFYRNHIHSRSI